MMHDWLARINQTSSANRRLPPACCAFLGLPPFFPLIRDAFALRLERASPMQAGQSILILCLGHRIATRNQ